ncbi:hypothetical protein [Massilia phosphatilytica]
MAARLRGSAEIVMFVPGPTLVGLLAFAATAAMLAAAEPLPLAQPAAPARRRDEPAHRVPRPRVTPVHRVAASAAGAAGGAGAPRPSSPTRRHRAPAWRTWPSLAVWLYQRPDWLAPPRAVAGSGAVLPADLDTRHSRGAGLPQPARRRRRMARRPATRRSTRTQL